jgi:glycine/D-amino acid oxidase-like deaminating enzyme
VATAPLSRAQWEAIGWQNRQGLSDLRTLFSYLIPTADGRIVIGGSDYTYYSNDRLTSGNDKEITRKVENDLFAFFPQLEGLKIDHAWGGTTAGSLHYTPSVSVMGDDKNIYFSVGHSEGVPSTQTAGRMIADLIGGESNAFTNHYIINSSIPYAGPVQLRSIFARGAKWFYTTFE